ncbi:MAG: threonine--tRNA ligase [Candidatus Harrisonbacteria bacterium]|nr:threonine--tRNA ligase [Candidatus Harrisonbacteria bacterium]
MPSKKTAISSLDAIRHSLSHVLAIAVLKKFPDAKLAIGPTIDDGFYYDFLLPSPLSIDDLPELEESMREIIKANLPFSGEKVSAKIARDFLPDAPFKHELIDELEKKGEEISLYKTGDAFIDLCRGGHVNNTSEIPLDSWKLHKVAGAYWRGDNKREQLTRIYGLAFESKTALDAHLTLLAEAEKRDHKKLGPELGLFFFHDTAPGMAYWLPKGMIVMNELVNFWRKEHEARGYSEISSPLINKKALWETSGHWEHYKDDMFICDHGEDEVYGVKAMNCPNAMIVFGSTTRSYRDLPLRLSDTDMLHRHELSGTLNGLLRVRSFRQDDSHNFITEDMVKSEYEAILEIADRFYSIFDLKYRLRLSTRPEKFLGDKETWDRAERELKEILDTRCGKDGYEIAEGDGAFYGPKIDIVMEDALGRKWQMGTIQLDFQQPRRFNLEYTGADGKKHTPIVIHRVIYGSLERFIGILIEHTAGHFPLWLSPVQVKIVNVGLDHEAFASKLKDELKIAGIRAELDASNETLGKKIRTARLEKVPYLIVVGDNEISSKNFNLEAREKEKNYTGGKDELISHLHSLIKAKK